MRQISWRFGEVGEAMRYAGLELEGDRLCWTILGS